MFRFSIRDCLLLTAVAATSVAWWLDHARLMKQVSIFRAAVHVWEYRAGAVADWVSDDGWKVDWTPGGVNMSKPGAALEARTPIPE